MLRTFLRAALLALLLPWPSADAQMLQAIVDAGAAAAPPAYTGPGDLSLGGVTWKNWYGLRAFSAATRGNRLVNVCDDTSGSFAGCADLVSDASTGALVAQNINSGAGTCPGTLGIHCKIKIFYDQGSNALNLTAIQSQSAVLNATCNPGGGPCWKFIGGTSLYASLAGQDGTVYATNPGSMVISWTRPSATPGATLFSTGKGASDANTQNIWDGGAAGGSANLFEMFSASTSPKCCGQAITNGTAYVSVGSFNGTGTSFTEKNGTDVTGTGMLATNFRDQVCLGRGHATGCGIDGNGGTYNEEEFGLTQGILASGGGTNGACVWSKNAGLAWGVTVSC